MFESIVNLVTSRRAERKFERKLVGCDADAVETLRAVREYTLLGPDKLFSFVQALRYVVRAGVPGDIVECGVWRGGAIMAAALTLRQLGVEDRRFFLYDTFTGMTQPTSDDRGLVDGPDPRAEFERRRTAADSSDWCRASLQDVRQNLSTLPYPQQHFELIEGKVEETIPQRRPERIAILRLDTDWYESTRHEMEHLMPLLSPGGVLIIDDYYNWSGNQQAVDEYLEREKLPLLLTKVARSAIGVRP